MANVISIIDSVNHFLCWVGKKRLIRTEDKLVKVNIGCGLTVAPEWINIDASLNVLFSKWPRFILKVLYYL